MTEQYDPNLEPVRPEAGGEGGGPAPAAASVWDLMLGVLTSPGQAMAQVAAQRPVSAAALLVFGLSVYSLVMASFGVQDAVLMDLGTMPPGTPPEFVEAMTALLPRLTVVVGLFGVVGTVLWWFVRAAVYGLLGELMGSRGDGRALLATLGFASLPVLVQAPVGLMANRLGMGWLSTLAGFGFWLWSAVLSVLAIRASLRSETGRAVVIFIIPLGVGIGLAILAGVIFAIAMASVVANL